MDLTAETSPRSYCSTLWYLPEVLNLFDWNVYNIFISFYKCCLESPLVCFVCWSRLGWVFIVGPPHWLGSLWLHCSLFLTVVSVLNQYRFQPLPTVWTSTLKEKKKQVTGYLLPERLLLPSKVAYGIVLSLPLVSWPRGSLGFHPPPLWDFPITALISTICHHFLFYGSFFQRLKNMLKFCYLKKCVVFFLTFNFCLGIANYQHHDIFRWKAKGLSHTYPCVYSPRKLPSHPGYHITLSRAPCATQ